MTQRALVVLMLLAACGEDTLEIEEPVYDDDDAEVVDTAQPLTTYAGISYRGDLEAQIASQLQTYRVANGLRPLVGEARLVDIARERAGFMLAKKKAGCTTWFTHKYISGCTETTTAHIQMLIDQRIGSAWPWIFWGENIVWNNYPDDTTAAAMMTAWKSSPGHDALMRSSAYNYVGIGVAKDDATGVKVGVIAFYEAKDITRPRATSLSATNNTDGTTTIRWGGGTDTFVYDSVAYPLQSHNAGFKNYDLRYRRTGTTTWYALLSGTTATSYKKTLTKGVSYDLRVRIRDNNGNLGYRNIVFVR